jgi:hypothetical protein
VSVFDAVAVASTSKKPSPKAIKLQRLFTRLFMPDTPGWEAFRGHSCLLILGCTFLQPVANTPRSTNHTICGLKFQLMHDYAAAESPLHIDPLHPSRSGLKSVLVQQR